MVISNLSLFQIYPLLSMAFILGLGILVFFKKPKAVISRLFFIVTIVFGIWQFGTFMMFISFNDAAITFWDRFIYLGVVFMPALQYHFSLLVTRSNITRKVMLIIAYIFSVTFLFLSRTDYFTSGVYHYRWGAHTIAQILHHFFLVFFFFYIFALLYNFYCHFRDSDLKSEKYRIVYFAVSFAILNLVGGMGYLPAYKISVYPISLLAPLVFSILITYAILKYRLMDIRVAIKRSTIFSGVVIIITATYALSAFLLGWVIFGGVYTFQSQITIGLIVAVLVAFGFKPLYEWLKRITDTFLFKGEYLPHELMADISDVLSRTLDLDKVISILKEQIGRALRVKKMEVVVLEEDIQKTNKSLKKIISHFKKQREVLVLDEIKKKQEDKVEFDRSFLLIKDMEKLNIVLTIPLLVKEKLVGLFLLSAKKSGDMFTNEDIKTLEAIASQAAIAVENARLYEEMKDFSKTLQKEVNRQTKSLRDANIRLEQLDRAKSEFISLASHQLRTPLSIIKGYISMILEGTWGETNKEQKEYLERVYLSNERLIKLVEDLLTVSRIESGRLDFDYQPLALDNLVESMVKEFSQIALKKGLYLKYIKTEKPMPKVKADSLKIRQVIQNLIDNAIHYTKKGGATIHLKAYKNKVRFSIKDTGIGISSEEQVTLFEKFSRGREVVKMHTEGTGLGLYLAAKLVEAHQGKIWIESQGKGKGSTFYFELPIVRGKK